MSCMSFSHGFYHTMIGVEERKWGRLVLSMVLRPLILNTRNLYLVLIHKIFYSFSKDLKNIKEVSIRRFSFTNTSFNRDITNLRDDKKCTPL